MSTHTYVVLEVSAGAYKEIYEKLKAAGYEHAFRGQDGRTVIDMHGIAVGVDGTKQLFSRAETEGTEEHNKQ